MCSTLRQFAALGLPHVSLGGVSEGVSGVRRGGGRKTVIQSSGATDIRRITSRWRGTPTRRSYFKLDDRDLARYESKYSFYDWDN